MYKTLRISFALRSAYHVNAILYALRQLPLVKRLLPASLYGSRPLNALANLLSLLWELATFFLGKLLYFLTMIWGASLLLPHVPVGAAFLHILLLLTCIGTFTNTNLFDPSREKYYAIFLLRMDARGYALVNYGYALLKVIIGFLPFTLYFGLAKGLPVWVCLMLPPSIAGAKLAVAGLSMLDYERRGLAYNENSLGLALWSCIGVVLLLAYGLPALGLVLPAGAYVALFALFLPLGGLGLCKAPTFGAYRAPYQQLLFQAARQTEDVQARTRRLSERSITADTSIVSRRHGFEYFNELFVKRHRRVLWMPAARIALASIALVLIALPVLASIPQARARVNDLLTRSLPYFVFIMYAVNRGTSFTRSLFMNCDHSLLTYGFYKQPRMVLRLFAIRLREIVKVNLLPASVIGAGACLLLLCSGGAAPLDYAVYLVSLPCLSVFFSVHYLTLYYLLQPFNAATEMKSAAYQLALSATYLACFACMRLKVDALPFGLACIAFCLLYCALACALVYRLAPRTFRLRA